MSMPLQIALFLASVAVVVFVVLVIAVLLALRKQAALAVRQLEEVKSDVKLLVQDSRTLLQNVNTLTTRANQQMDDVDKVVRTVRGWSERANRIVEEVGAAVEPPLFSAVRNIGIVRKGVAIFMDALLRRNHHTEEKQEEYHGRE